MSTSLEVGDHGMMAKQLRSGSVVNPGWLLREPLHCLTAPRFMLDVLSVCGAWNVTFMHGHHGWTPPNRRVPNRPPAT